MRIIPDRPIWTEYKSLFLKIILISLPLSGCVSQPSAPTTVGDFWLTGKIAVTDRDTGHSARFTWQHTDDQYDIEVWGPLGQGRTKLRGDNDQMVISRADEVLVAGPPDQVMRQQLGWVVPIDVLPAWVRGRSSHVLPVNDEIRDAAGQLIGITQAQWQVTFSDFLPIGTAVGNGVSQPRKITATRDNYKVRVVIGDYRE